MASYPVSSSFWIVLFSLVPPQHRVPARPGAAAEEVTKMLLPKLHRTWWGAAWDTKYVRWGRQRHSLADDGYVVVPLKSHPSTNFPEYNEEIPACYKKEDRLSRAQKDKHTWPALHAVWWWGHTKAHTQEHPAHRWVYGPAPHLHAMLQLFVVLLTMSCFMWYRACEVPCGSWKCWNRRATAVFSLLRHYQQTSKVGTACSWIDVISFYIIAGLDAQSSPARLTIE